MSVSFLAIAAIVNGLGVIASAGVGVAEKLCGFIMLVLSAFGQSLSAFVAQNIGAGQYSRVKRAMLYGMGGSLCCGIVLAWLTFFYGNLLAGLFARDGPGPKDGNDTISMKQGRFPSREAALLF